MASEKAKELARKQKEAIRAEKLRKKNSDDPRDWSRRRQIVESYRRTKEVDPALPWWMLGVGLGVWAVFGILAIFIRPWWLTLIFGALFGGTAAMFVMTTRMKKAMFKRYEGQPGSAEVVLSMLNKKRWSYSLAVAFNKQMDLVHRVVGRQGIILIGEGKTQRLTQMLKSEKRKHESIAYGVPVQTVIVGNEEDQIPLAKLQKHLETMPRVIPAAEVTEVITRTRALDAIRPKAPMPKGPMPKAKGVGRALRGR